MQKKLKNDIKPKICKLIPDKIAVQKINLNRNLKLQTKSNAQNERQIYINRMAFIKSKLDKMML